MNEDGLVQCNAQESVTTAKGNATMYIILSRKYGSAVMNRGSIRIFDTNKEAEQWIKDCCEYPRDAYVIFELTEREPIL